MGFSRMLGFRFIPHVLVAVLALSARSSELVTTISTTNTVLTNGQKLTVWFNILNPGNAPEDYPVTRKLAATVVAGGQRVPFDLTLADGANADRDLFGGLGMAERRNECDRHDSQGEQRHATQRRHGTTATVRVCPVPMASTLTR